ncbi:MAG: hypothetical protein RMJ97_12535, partial [Raineya sp.]|nr:hypothetical protein [Raineya sp.]
MNVQVFFFNENYIIKFQLGDYEQSIRFPASDLKDPKDLAQILDDSEIVEMLKNNFLKLREVAHRFLQSENQERGEEI